MVLLLARQCTWKYVVVSTDVRSPTGSEGLPASDEEGQELTMQGDAVRQRPDRALSVRKGYAGWVNIFFSTRGVIRVRCPAFNEIRIVFAIYRVLY